MKKRGLTLPLDVTLHYSPGDESFSVSDHPELILDETEKMEILSFSGFTLKKESFLNILRKRSICIKKSPRLSSRAEVILVPLVVPIRILGLSLENSITRFQLLEHARQE
jgi:hypothetical protein